MELERIGDSDGPFEGNNVTLICRTIYPEVKFPAPPEWAYQANNTGRLQVINEAIPPKGSSYFDHSFKKKRIILCFKQKQTSGVQITTRDYSNQRNTGGFKLNYYESRLELTAITRNTFTTFQCKANRDKDAVTKTISFRIKGKIIFVPSTNRR